MRLKFADFLKFAKKFENFVEKFSFFLVFDLIFGQFPTVSVIFLNFFQRKSRKFAKFRTAKKNSGGR